MTAATAAVRKLAAAQPSRARGRPKLADVAEIEGSLLDIALQTFLRHGYGGTSMTSIVKAAGVSKTTLYSRYSSKEQLFRAIISQQSERTAASTLLRLDTSQLNLVHGLSAYANRTLDISLKGDILGINRLIFSESHRFPELGVAAAERTQSGVRQIADFIRECSTFDEVPCRDPEGVAEVFIHMLRGWYLNVMLTNREVPASTREQWVELAVRTLVSSRADW